MGSNAADQLSWSGNGVALIGVILRGVKHLGFAGDSTSSLLGRMGGMARRPGNYSKQLRERGPDV